LEKYFFKISSYFFNNKQYFELSATLVKTNFIFSQKTLNVLKILSSEILAEENMEELENLKIIFERNINLNDPEIKKFHKITHYQILKFQIKEYKNKFPTLFYNLNLSLIKYGNIIKLDLVLLDLIKFKEKNDGNIFHFTNLYLELFDIIQFGGELPTERENLVFLDFPLNEAYLSANNLISISEKEELVKWMEAKSIDKNYNKNLSFFNCVKCHDSIFEVIFILNSIANIGEFNM
jgi:hypothetical protein